MVFFKRISAFIIDCIILLFAMVVVNMFIPVSGDATKLSERAMSLTNDYLEQTITLQEFNEQTKSINYDITKATYISTVASIVVYILYFVVFQAYNNGQTLGKKLLKIRVVKNDDSKVDINTLLIRSLIPYGILVNFILAVLMLFVKKGIYITISGALNNIQMIIIAVTIVMMLFKSRGLHDYWSKTKVEQL